ncbi:putative methyltransferase-like protein 25 [Chanos chanos]|uniref:Methyltransferase-like protein 25 n=1 Tax=Chanos chanos TaxID=29144 RepID=A0A6J2W424_CHACN|nr:methyltransferase-like protein 25 [Chanos chanos]
MAVADVTLDALKRKLDEVQRFLHISLSIANAHTVDFYTHDVWSQFMAVTPEDVLTCFGSTNDLKMAPEVKEKATFGFCNESKKLVDVSALVKAAKDRSLPGLGVCLSRTDLLKYLRAAGGERQVEKGETPDDIIVPDEFMNCKKAHEVQAMSEVVSSLAKHCEVKQVIDVGSGKGYLCTYLSMQYLLQVFGIDSSATNTHGAQERNRKLRKFSRAYQRHGRAIEAGCPTVSQPQDSREKEVESRHSEGGERRDIEEKKNERMIQKDGVLEECHLLNKPDEDSCDSVNPDGENPFLSALSLDVVETPSPRVPPSELSMEERERRKRENLERKAQNAKANGSNNGITFSPLTSYITAETELQEIVPELEDAVLVGLHTCGDLAASTLRMFVAKRELNALCSVGCCYHLLSEEFEPTRQECENGIYGFPVSQYLRGQACFCGRNARMSACLALERVTVGGGLPMESLFYRAVLHVILQDHYDAHKSERRVGNVYSKASSFVDYVRRALRKLQLDDSKLSDSIIQGYHDQYKPRMNEMVAFNMLKVTLAPCIEGLILLDRLCYLKEQENVRVSALVQLFDPLRSPRCYAVVGVKTSGKT